MKDSIITAKRKKIELYTFLVCFIIANALHVYSIIAYKGHWIELITSFFYVLTFTVFLYIVWTMLRLVICYLVHFFRKQH